MHSSIPVLAAALAASSYASPVAYPPVGIPRLGFTQSVQLTRSNRSDHLNPALSLAYPYYKYNVPMPQQIRIAATKQTAKVAATKQGAKNTDLTGTVTTTPEPYDVEYLVPVNVNGKVMNLVLDSGSSDLWVFSDHMPSAQTSGHATYQTSNSKLKPGQTFHITYGDGSYAKGKVYADRVTIGGVTATNQAVEAASAVSDSFLKHQDADGLIGLSMSSLNTVQPTQQNTFFDNVKSKLASPIYAVTLKKQAVGSLDFGYINRTKYVGNINYINVNPSNAHFWQFLIKRYAVNGVEQPAVNPFVAIVDTGTSLTYLPSTIIKNYYSRIAGSQYDSNWGGYTFPCDAKIPPMGLFINGVKYPIRGDLINWERISSTHCLGGIQSSDSLPFAILGDVFLKTVYVVFDSSKSVPRVGFARQNPNSYGGGNLPSTTKTTTTQITTTATSSPTTSFSGTPTSVASPVIILTTTSTSADQAVITSTRTSSETSKTTAAITSGAAGPKLRR